MNRPRHRRPGFTLYELLLVLAVLGLLAAFTFPIASWWFRDYELRRSAEELRVALGRARVWAVDSGMPYQFRFEPGGRKYLVLPADVEDVPATGATESATSAAAAAPPEFDYLVGEFSEAIRFENAPPTGVPVEPLNPRVFGILPNAEAIGGASWSPPLEFRPDGTTDTVSIEILDEDEGHAILLDVRGLTGAVSLSPIRAPEGR